jgi:serine/threonine-protein kinase RsbW
MERKDLCIEVEIRVPNQTRYLSLIGKIGEDLARELDQYRGDLPALASHINLVLTEAMANAIQHANAGDPSKTVRIVIRISDEELHIEVYDEGQGFDIQSIPPPDFERLEDRGRGLFVIRTLMDSVSYRAINGGNVLKMFKRLT